MVWVWRRLLVVAPLEAPTTRLKRPSQKKTRSHKKRKRTTLQPVLRTATPRTRRRRRRSMTNYKRSIHCFLFRMKFSPFHPFFIVIIATVVRCQSTPIRYDGESLVRIPRSTYNRLHSSIPSRPWSMSLESVDIVANNDTRRLITSQLQPNETMEIVIDDLQKPVDEESARLQATATAKSAKDIKALAAGENEFVLDYRRYSDIVTYVNMLPNRYSSLNVHVFASIGKTVEARDMVAFSVTSKNEGTSKRTVYIQSGLHARERVTVATALYFCNQLFTGYEAKDVTITALLDKLIFVFVPVVNPDGYEYTWSTNRYWRKNMARYANGTLYGVDLNRNFPTMWGLEEGSSTNPMEDDYRGPSAASEPETKAIMTFVSSLNNVLIAIDLHSYSQLVLRPRYYTGDLPADDAQLRYLGKGIAAEIQRVSNLTYASQRGFQLYKTSGDVTTYIRSIGASGKSENEIYTFALELSPSGQQGATGFVLDKSMIPVVGNGVTAGLVWLAQTASSGSSGTLPVGWMTVWTCWVTMAVLWML